MSVECNCGTETLGLLMTHLEQNRGCGRAFQNCPRQRQSERKDKGRVNSANPILLVFISLCLTKELLFILKVFGKITLRGDTEVVAVKVCRKEVCFLH